MKKIVRGIAPVILVLCIIVSVASPVTAEHDILSIGRVSAVMPDVTVELKGTGHDTASLTATLGDDNLSVVSAVPCDTHNISTCTYALIDLSTSMYGTFDLVKQNLITYIEGLGDDDKLVLLTFGETEVTTALSGSESREDAINLVNGLECNEEGTLLYEALNKAYRLSNGSTDSYDREYVLLFTDGEDWQKGSSTFNEVSNLYKDHSLPIYTACYDASQEAANKMGELSRSSGGSISIVQDELTFGDLLTGINDVTVLKFKAPSNRADGTEKLLSIKSDGLQVDFNVQITRSIPDTDAPTVKELSYDKDKGAFVCTFSEKVLGAQNASTYKVVAPDGHQIKVSNVFLNENNQYEIKLEEPVSAGEYTFSFSGITDASKEENVLQGQQTVVLSETDVELPADTNADPEPDAKNDDSPMKLIIPVAVGVFVLIALTVTILVVSRSKKKKKEDGSATSQSRPQEKVFEHISSAGEVVKHHVINDNTVCIRLNIKSGGLSEQTVKTNVLSSLIVGRSETCDVYIDDTKLSRQHFVIENDDGVLYVMDLQSRNGTMLNGIRINNRQVLRSGDKILAGLSDITVTVIR